MNELNRQDELPIINNKEGLSIPLQVKKYNSLQKNKLKIKNLTSRFLYLLKTLSYAH